MPVRTLLESNREEIIRIAAAHGARNLRIFGSVVRGEEDESSDIDLLVEIEPGHGLLSRAALTRELTQLLGRRVDVVSEKGLRERVRTRVMREAVPL